jgi:hypothetical protein
VTPDTSLNPAGQIVLVSGSGFGPLEHFLTFQCHVLEAPPPPPAPPNETCVPIVFSHNHADEAGNIGPMAVTVTRTFVGSDGTVHDCATLFGCNIWVVEEESNPPRNAHHPISFVSVPPAETAPPADFDGDGDTDLAVFRPSTGTWFVNGGATVAWGASGDLVLPLPAAIQQAFSP